MKRKYRGVQRLCSTVFFVLLFMFFCRYGIETCYAAQQDGKRQGATVLDHIEDRDSYSAVIYNNTSGLPTSEANAIAETEDGFIWIGGYSGLIRYDGSTFERMDSTTGIASVVSLFVDGRDRLWIGTNDSGLAVMEKGIFTMWTEADGLPAAKICGIAEDENGNIYAGTTAGIAVIDQNMQLHVLDDEELDGLYIETLKSSPDGCIYGISNTDDIFMIRDGALSMFLGSKEFSIEGAVMLLPDPDNPGYLYIGTQSSELYYGCLDDGFEDASCTNIEPLIFVSDIQKAGDNVVICARNGIGVLQPDGLLSLQDLPMDNSVGHMMTDYEGNLWFTSTRQGVMKLVPNQFTDLFTRYGLPETVVNSTCMSEDMLFVATDTGLIVLNEDGPVGEIPLTKVQTASGEVLDETDLISMLEGCRIRSIIRDRRGRLWISTWRARGLLRYDRGEVLTFSEADGLISDHVRAVCEQNDGRILVVNSGGVSVINGDRVEAKYGKEQGILNTESLTVSYGWNGDILLGSNGGGIYVINEDGVGCIGTKDGLTSGIIMRIKRDPVRHIYWIVTSNSLAFMSSDYQVTTVHKFPYSNNYDLYENSRGDMWILSSNGIYVLPAKDLLLNGEMSPAHYDMGSGMPCYATGNSYSELTSAGDLYIAGGAGVTKVNIEKPLENIKDMKLGVPYIEIDGIRSYPDETGRFIVPAGTQKLTIYSFAFNYLLTDPWVEYRLEGFDRANEVVRRSELVPIDYTNLPGGVYAFVLRLKDSQGRISKTITVPVIKEKAYHEQLWFYAAIAIAIAAALTGGTWGYIRRKTRIMEEKNREAVKKARLNTELKMASAIQGGILPHDFPPFPERTEFDLYASMHPAREVGGDFYDFFLIDDDHLCMVIADVSGKGIPASLFMMVSKSIVQNCAKLGKSAAEILAQTNEQICSANQADMFVTVWVGILEISTGIITAANAGHEYPAMQKDGSFTLLKDRHGLVIGGMEGTRYREYEIALSPGDKIFVYTDGVPEATDAQSEMFGKDRMLDALNLEKEAKPEKILQNVRQAVNDFVKDAEQFDDVTMLCLEYKGTGG